MTAIQKLQARMVELENRLANAEGRIAKLESERPNRLGPSVPITPHWPEPHPYDTHPIPSWPNYPKKPQRFDDLEITCQTERQPSLT